MIFISSARITNPQLGVEEISGDIRLLVEGIESATEEEIPPTIIVPPVNTTIVRESNIAHLQCIANARLVHSL